MSATVNFNTDASAPAATKAAGSASKAVVILPSQLLVKLIGRRVTVLLSQRNEELEGVLRSVDDDRGDVFLDDVVHYVWFPAVDETAAESHPPAEDQIALDGGGTRRELRRQASAMVNSRFIELITPTVFEPVGH